MPKWSLEKWLHSTKDCLDMIQRLNIVIDVASALEYLHHGYTTSVVHCDLKPSNILPNEGMVAHVISALHDLGEGDSAIQTMTLATIGYMAPAKEDSVAAILELALRCSADTPEERKDMKEVLAAIKKIKTKFVKIVDQPRRS
ncbi:serine-threonine protein kinase, plant-type, putative [Ricinus communis]|uniref:Serine-threonine protein kinase, plant-type, putative n=1 Tax=Ricinus communis TaxID=3988 RepID=B9STS4_RICCO|nr:serine-threonine protein kinase, plant-type, putative [Ricinus communis]